MLRLIDENIIVGAAFGSSLVSAAFGIGGGMLFLVILTSILPPSIAVPIHTLNQLISDSARSTLLRKYLHRKILLECAVGCLIGLVAGLCFRIPLPDAELRVGIGLFVLVATWFPKLASLGDFSGRWIVVGAVASSLSSYIGIAGQVFAPFLAKENLGKERFTATLAACQVLARLANLTLFLSLGFSFAPYLGLLAKLVAAGFLGSWLGGGVLVRLPQSVFHMAFKIIMTLLCAHVILH